MKDFSTGFILSNRPVHWCSCFTLVTEELKHFSHRDARNTTIRIQHQTNSLVSTWVPRNKCVWDLCVWIIVFLSFLFLTSTEWSLLWEVAVWLWNCTLTFQISRNFFANYALFGGENFDNPLSVTLFSHIVRIVSKNISRLIRSWLDWEANGPPSFVWFLNRPPDNKPICIMVLRDLSKSPIAQRPKLSYLYWDSFFCFG